MEELIASLFYYKGSLQNTNMVGKEKFGMGGQSPDDIDDDDNDCDDDSDD